MPPLPKGEARHHRGQMLQYLGLPLAPPLGELASVSETERVSHQNRKRAAARSNVQRPSFAETGKKMV
ncbi:hypothetical protein D3F01_04095 [Faecalibacterium sp. BCRC 81149]|nr:hypothetical protein [Faecalibacterium sp. BCRC 81149]